MKLFVFTLNQTESLRAVSDTIFSDGLHKATGYTIDYLFATGASVKLDPDSCFTRTLFGLSRANSQKSQVA